MGFNFLSSLGGAVTGAMGGAEFGPAGMIAGGALGGLSGIGGGASSMVGNLANGALQTGMARSETDQVSNELSQMNFDSQEQWQNTAFNQMLEQKSQAMEQVNNLRDVAMQQRKADDSITKEYIQAIKS